MVLDWSLRTWMGRIGWPKEEEFCANWGTSATVLIGTSAAPPLASSPVPDPSAAINRIFPIDICCCKDVGTMMLCIGNAAGAGRGVGVASTEGLPLHCWIVLIVIRDWGWRGGGEQDLWLISGDSVLMTWTRGGGEDADGREWRNWTVFMLWEWRVAGGDGLTLLTAAEVAMGSLLPCSKFFKAEVFITCIGWWCCVPFIPLSCEGWEMRRIGCPAIVWITFIGAWRLLREMPLAVIGMKLAGLLVVAAAWSTPTGVPPLVEGRRVGVWTSVGWLLPPAVCTKLTGPPTWPAGVVVNIRFCGRVMICPPWPGWEVNTLGAQMLTGLCSLGLVVPRHMCFGDGSSETSGLRFRLTERRKSTERKKYWNSQTQSTCSVHGVHNPVTFSEWEAKQRPSSPIPQVLCTYTTVLAMQVYSPHLSNAQLPNMTLNLIPTYILYSWHACYILTNFEYILPGIRKRNHHVPVTPNHSDAILRRLATGRINSNPTATRK